MSPEVNQAQMEPQQDVTQPETPGAEHVEVVLADVQKEAVTEPQQPAAEKPPKTYTQKEWQEWETAKDKEVAQYRQALAQAAMREQIQTMQSAEELARVRDTKALEMGEISEEQVQQKQQQRLASYQQQVAQQQQQALQQQQLMATRALMEWGEKVGRIKLAEDLAKEYEIDAAELIGDKTITNVDQMKGAAAKLALRKAKSERSGPETFDSGHVGGTRRNIDQMSPEEKVIYGLKQKR